MKTCGVCGSTEFSGKNCKPCNVRYQIAWQKRNPDKIRERRRFNRQQRRLRFQEFIYRYYLEHPCVDCGEDDPRVLEFDHIGPKSANISSLVHKQNSFQRLKDEIKQCEIRCANCHRRRTAEVNGWYSRFAQKPRRA